MESDISLSEENIRGQRNFSNKIWNIARYVLTDSAKASSFQFPASSKHKDDRRIAEELKKTTEVVTKSLDDYRLNEAASEAYDFVWHKFADVYIERVKDRRDEARPTLLYVLQESLKLLHPFMPFVTEAIWQNAREQQAADSPEKLRNGASKQLFKERALITAEWPK